MKKKVIYRGRVKPEEADSFTGSCDSGAKKHCPVLLQEAVDALIHEKDGVYVDATFGRGGHSRRILQNISEQGVLICIDKDQAAVEVAKQLDDKRVVIKHGSFSKLGCWVEELGLKGKIEGILLDLGVSSPQLDDPMRGFSFLRDGPLDMRMDQSQKLDAALWIKNAKESEMEQVFRVYGEERFSKRIARAIVREREVSPIMTTGRLAEIVKLAHPRWELHKHPATRVFQAIRILVNSELEDISNCLEQCLEVLAVGGRLVVISFHSLEDRIVKKFVKKHKGGGVPEWLPVMDEQIPKRVQSIGGAIHASQEEVDINPRSRSAVLRVVEKLK